MAGVEEGDGRRQDFRLRLRPQQHHRRCRGDHSGVCDDEGLTAVCGVSEYGAASIWHTRQRLQMTSGGALSPAGDRHPGEIQHVDLRDGREWTVAASQVPQSVAWVADGSSWKAVVRVQL